MASGKQVILDLLADLQNVKFTVSPAPACPGLRKWNEVKSLSQGKLESI